MTAETISEVLNKLIGNVLPVGETRADEQALRNLGTLMLVCDDLIDKIYECSKYKDKCEFSVKAIGGSAWRYLEYTEAWMNGLMEKKE